MVFKGSLQRAREIGEALNADHLLEGSARRDGSRVRITARLIEAATESQLWSETYERTVADWLSVQADVAGRVARSLMRELVPATRAVVAPRDHPPAYQAYLKGQISLGETGRRRAGRVAALVSPRRSRRRQTLRRRSARWRACGVAQRGVLPRAAAPGSASPRASRRLARSRSIPSVSEAVAVLAATSADARHGLGGGRSQLPEALALNPEQRVALRSYGLSAGALVTIRGGARYVERARELDPLCLWHTRWPPGPGICLATTTARSRTAGTRSRWIPEFVTATACSPRRCFRRAGATRPRAAGAGRTLTCDPHPCCCLAGAREGGDWAAGHRPAAHRARPSLQARATCRRFISRWRMPASGAFD